MEEVVPARILEEVRSDSHPTEPFLHLTAVGSFSTPTYATPKSP